ncbi:OmpL47-type beta-barrel domain-containing protein [Paenibacillus sp. GCM10027628]|uniref:OmpL47-type beta-barrel domain-containing protein n=1 Tax=Paenibacillus sp. GCM10027628 TaxID=3273413 RepID=UPI00363C4070
MLKGKKTIIVLLSAGLIQIGLPYGSEVAKADTITSQNALLVVQNYTGVFNTKPTVFNDHTSDAPLLGNGDVGIVIGGGIDQMTFYAGKNEFWSRDQKRTKALGRIALSVPSMAGASYFMEQDIAHAEVRGNFTLNGNTIHSTSWVSATDNLLMTKLSYTGSSSAPVTVSLKDGTGATISTANTITGDVLSMDVQADPVYQPTKIGREDYSGGRWYFNGNMDDFRIYNRALSDTEVSQLYNLQSVSSGLTTQYTFDSIPTGAVNTSLVAGKIGNALSFNGTSSYWDAGLVSINANDNKSLGAWIYVPSYATDANYMFSQGEWNQGTSLGLSGGKLRFQTVGGKYADSPSAVPTNSWVHVMGTYDGQNIKLYINGALVKSSVVGPPPPSSTNPISRVRMSTRVINTTGTVSNGQLSFTMQPGQTYTLATSLISNTDSNDYQNTSVSKVSALTQADIDALNQTHRNWWQDYWSKSFVEIPNKTIEKSWYGSLYLLGSSMRGNKYAPGLWGPWATQDMAWNGDFHLNYNYETPFYAMYPTNHVDAADSYDQPILDWIPNAQAGATAAGFSGVYYPVAIGPLPGGSPDSSDYYNQKTNAVNAATNMVMRYYYTRDTAYASKVYNYLKLVGAFWTNYLVWDGTRYVIYNDAQHEGDTYPQTNGVMSLGFVRLLFQGLIDMSTDLNQDAALRTDWQNKLNNLSAFPTQVRNSQTVFRYTEVGRDWNSGNSIGVQHIFPGSQIGLDSDSTTKQIAYNMVDQMQRWADENGTPLFYPSAARVGYNPTTILTQLYSWITSRSYNNMHIHTDGGGIENLNTVPTTVNEMLLQSYQGKIRVFANWPANTYAKFGDFRAYGGFLVSSDMENNIVQYVRLISEKGRNATLVNPWPDQTLVIYRNGVASGTLSGSEINITTSPNETIHIAPNGTSYNDIISKLSAPGGQSSPPSPVDDKDVSIIYNGTWSNYSDSGDYLGTEKYSRQTNANVQFTFNGTSIKWIGPMNSNGGKADVYIDGVLDQAAIDTYATGKQYQQVLYSKVGLTPGTHTIKVVVTGTKNPSASDTVIVVDAFEYGTSIPVSSIAVSGINGTALINQANGTLQMTAAVKPDNADDKSVSWGVQGDNGAATDAASINAAGLLTAIKDGIVTVVANAKDGSGVKGENKVMIDTTPPLTAVSVAAAAPDGANGWYVHPVTLSLNASDNVSGLAKTEYSLDGGTTWQNYSSPVTLNQDGKYAVSYRSTDNAGNVETPKTVSFNLDATAPTITVSGVVYGTFNDTESIVPIIVLSDEMSGADNSKTTMTLDANGVQQGTTIPLYTLPLGSHTLVVTASDLAGNNGSQTVVFQTTTSIDSLKALVTHFASTGWIHNAGIANSLLSKLTANNLADFVSEVKAQSGKHVSVQAANYLLRDALYLLSQGRS